MLKNPSPTWLWEETDPRRSGGAGDLAKLFRNESIAAPGVLAANPPSPAASLLAREVIQNSWDAAAELAKDLLGTGEATPQFGINFEFGSASGAERGSLAEALDLSGLSAQFNRASDAGQQGALGLARSSALAGPSDESAPIRYLRIVESGTTGMYGPFESAQSKMFLALVSLGYTVKGPGSGGSYGYGKAGLIAGSATRTVVAYSCFLPRSDDQEDGAPVTRRLLGMTYWGQHSVDGQSFTGFARLGDNQGGWVRPLTNDAADDAAVALGLRRRDASDLSDLGTTFLLLDPVVEPDDLRNAIERNWWAAIEERRFTPLITDLQDDGNTRTIVPRPKKNPVLASFVRAYEIATTPQDNDVAEEHGADLGELPGALDSLKIGRIGLVADLDGWSYWADAEGDDGAQVEQASLVALLRGPLMTVEYFRPRGTRRPPFVRGAFVADAEVDDLLRQSEPKAHDEWVTTLDKLGEDVSNKAPRVAQEVLKAVASQTRKFQERLKPPPPDASNIRLDVLAGLFKGLARGDSGIPPLPPPDGDRDLSIGISSFQESDDSNERVRVCGTVKVRLADAFDKADQAVARVRVSYRFLEDERAGEHCPLAFSGPLGDPDDDGWMELVVTRKFIEFSFESSFYESDWSGRLAVSAEVIRELAEGEN